MAQYHLCAANDPGTKALGTHGPLDPAAPEGKLPVARQRRHVRAERSSGLPELRRSLGHGPAVCACALGKTGPSQLGSNRHVTVVHARSVDESENLPRKGSGGVRVYVVPLQLSFYLIFAGPAYEPRTETGLHVTDQQPTTRAPHHRGPTGAPPLGVPSRAESPAYTIRTGKA